MRSVNHGLSWTRESTPATNNLKGISVINGTTGWAVGANGIVLRRGDFSGVEQVNSAVPSEFKLLSNYPNPFNSSTIIRFELPAKTIASVVVYNILGMQVELLIPPTQLSAGNYRISWAASTHPSGVYICKLQAGDFTGCTKLVLLK